MALSTLTLAMSATTPVLADIAAAFPDAHRTTIALLITVPSLLSVPCSLITGRIVGRRVGYRTMALLGAIILFLGGLLPYFLNALSLIVASRALMGVGIGILAPITPSVTMNTLPRELAQRQMGVNGAVANAAALVYQLIGGFVGVYSWRYSFLTYLLVLPVLALVLFGMREPEPMQAAQNKGSDSSTWQTIRSFKGAVWGWCALLFLFIVLLYAYLTNIAVIISQNHYGSAMASALVLVVFSLGGVAGGQLLSRIVTKIQKGVFIVAGIACFAGKMMLVVGDSLAMMFLGSLAFGLGYGLFLPAVAMFLGMSVPPEQRAFALSINTIGSGAGTFLSAYIFSALASITGNQWDRFEIFVSAFGYLAIAAGFAVSMLERKRQSAKLT